MVNKFYDPATMQDGVPVTECMALAKELFGL